MLLFVTAWMAGSIFIWNLYKTVDKPTLSQSIQKLSWSLYATLILLHNGGKRDTTHPASGPDETPLKLLYIRIASVHVHDTTENCQYFIHAYNE